MTYLAKPKLLRADAPRNAVGYTRRDYEGAISTLCAGCGHDSISAAVVQACFDLDIEPHKVAKLSGIGCSSKTPDYFLGASHGFNTTHGRMPSVLTGAALANRDLIYLGVSGDGDSASIGIAQFAHAMRRGVNMTYICENNGVYGLTKGQFSATADKGSKNKRGVVNSDTPIDLVALALQLGATFVARSFSGDKEQLVPLIKGALRHRGPAFIDVISPCVTFNNHAGSTKSYDYVREHNEAVNRLDFILPRDKIETSYTRRVRCAAWSSTTARCCMLRKLAARLRSLRPRRRHELPAGTADAGRDRHRPDLRRQQRRGPASPPEHGGESRSTSWVMPTSVPAPRRWRRSTPR
jgi:2-oxoglutarate ferredoxin oxidoreductase subunit beta